MFSVQDGLEAIIVDTAGRLQIDEQMMSELADVRRAVRPTDTLLVVDAMKGQEAATLVKAFNDVASITGAPLQPLFSPSPALMARNTKRTSQVGHVNPERVLRAQRQRYVLERQCGFESK